MRLDELDYALPPELIAQEPADPRDASRLLVYRRPPRCAAGDPREVATRIEDRTFTDLPTLLRAGDVLVRNDTRVLAARTHFRRPSGGRLELLFLHAADPEDERRDVELGEVWEVLIRGRPRAGDILANEADPSWSVRVLRGFGDGRWLVESDPVGSVAERLVQCGETPLPPYIRRRLADPERYQTTFARRPGSAAAPTAGLHFTPSLDRMLHSAGIRIVEITLHVGLGTFKPLAADEVADNHLHAETFEVTADAWREVQRARDEGRRVVAVGTTAVRTLEHLAQTPDAVAHADGGVLRGSTQLFIYPGYTFRVVDAMVTNFHLPRTSLLALVMAFAGVPETRAVYDHAIRERYRFYSLGDAMMVL